MNKYLKRGIILLIIGVALGILGMYLKEAEMGIYAIVLIFSVIVFGIGFLITIYGLIRKIERRSILDERLKEGEKSKAS